MTDKPQSLNNTEKEFVNTMIEYYRVSTQKPIMKILLKEARKKTRVKNGIIRAKK